MTEQRIFKIAIYLVLINYAVWRLGVFLNHYGGWKDVFGATLCLFSYPMSLLLTFVILYYTIRQRFWGPTRRWYLYAPALAIAAAAHILYELQ